MQFENIWTTLNSPVEESKCPVILEDSIMTLGLRIFINKWCNCWKSTIFPNNVMLLTCTDQFALLHGTNLVPFTNQTKVSGSRSIKFKNKSTLYYILNKYTYFVWLVKGTRLVPWRRANLSVYVKSITLLGKIVDFQQLHHLLMNILKPRIIIESSNITGHLDSSTGECNIVQIFSNCISKFINKEM